MTRFRPTVLSVDPYRLDDANLARYLDGLLDDNLSSPEDLCAAIHASCDRRLRNNPSGAAAVLTRAEWVCFDALEFNARVTSGGFRQWIERGFWSSGIHTYEALMVIDARRAARLLRMALRALPLTAKAALQHGVANSDLPTISVGPRRAAYLGRLDAAFDAVHFLERISAFVATYAREAGPRMVRHPLP